MGRTPFGWRATLAGARPKRIDASNRYIVSRSREGIRIGAAPVHAMTDAEALNLAAWLVAMVEDGPDAFPRVLSHVLT